MADIVKEMAVRFTAKNEMTAATKQAADSLQNLQSKLSSLGRAMIGGGVVVGFTKLGRAILENVKYFDDLDDASQRIGMSAKNYQTLGLAAEFSGSGIDVATKAIDRLHKAIGESIITGKENEGLKRLGLSSKDFAGMDAYESFQKVSQATKNLGSVNLETASLMSLLGRGGAEQALVLRNLSEELDKAGQYTHGMISEDDIQKMADLSDKLAGMSVQLKNVIGTALTNYVEFAWGETDAQQFDKFYMGLGAAARAGDKEGWRKFWNDMKSAQESARDASEKTAKADAAAAENLARIGGIADRIRDTLQTPAEKMAEKIAEAKQALETIDPNTGKALLGQSEFDTYKAKLQEDFDRTDPATIERNKQLEEQKRAAEEWAKQRDALAQQYTTANLTPNEKYLEEMSTLNALLNEGRISWEMYSRAVGSAKRSLDEATGATARLNELQSWMESQRAATRTPYEQYQEQMARLNEAAAAGLGDPDLWGRIAWEAESALMQAMGNVMQEMPQMFGGGGGGRMNPYMMNGGYPPVGMYTQVYPMGGGASAPQTPGTAGMASATQIAGIMAGGNIADIAKQQLGEAKRQTQALQRILFFSERGTVF